MKNRANFLDVLKHSELERLLPQGICAGTAAQAVKPAGAVHADDTEFHAGLIFQILHLSAQRGLCDPKLSSGFGEVQCFADRQEISQMPEFHR